MQEGAHHQPRSAHLRALEGPRGRVQNTSLGRVEADVRLVEKWCCSPPTKCETRGGGEVTYTS